MSTVQDRCSKRLMKELTALHQNPPACVKVDYEKAMDDLTCWNIEITGAPKTLYEGEKFILEFTFSAKYPFESPEVMFVGANVPKHPHVYSNGHICLSTVSDDWTPSLTVETVCLSILSMLSNCKKKKKPIDDLFYSKLGLAPKHPKHNEWWFHDKKA